MTDFDKCAKVTQLGQDSVFNKGTFLYATKETSVPTSHYIQKLTPKLIIDVNVKSEALKIWKKNLCEFRNLRQRS